ncbi:MAG: radical SAM protein [Dehalococcoidia bacterium]
MSVSFKESVQIAQRLTLATILKRPVCVSFEVTHSCNARCKHCDKGGIKKGEARLQPKEYGNIAANLKPPFLQISGGEPLLREDVGEIVKQVKGSNHVPFVIFVTNASLLNEGCYVNLKGCGVNQFSISIDFPDTRHDEFRGIPGLFSRLESLMPKLAAFGNGDVVLNTAITSENVGDLLDLAQMAKEWGVSISYSAYSSLRTYDKGLSVAENIDLLEQQIEQLKRFKKEKGTIRTPTVILENILEFFREGSYIPNCKAGVKSMVVTPDGYFMPCAMHNEVKYPSRESMIESFSRDNTCGECYVSIRSMTEMGLRGRAELTLSHFGFGVKRTGENHCCWS